jgi:4-hydroxy-tetrahydrodipicolinate synthase
MVRSSLKADLKGAKQLNDQLIEAYDLMFAENNPAGVKAFLAELGLIENNLRLPMTPLSEGLYKQVKAYLKK